ncbi:hypothetical protein, partial [Pseudonocardia lacus]|uniref:hypothetical protein n=1 Tax=Pseudonocardia lacus TaxID=2835865 RepID=UPI001BDC1C49
MSPNSARTGSFPADWIMESGRLADQAVPSHPAGALRRPVPRCAARPALRRPSRAAPPVPRCAA